MVDLKAPTGRIGDPLQVIRVGAHHEVIAAQCPLDDAGIDNVAGRCHGREGARGSGARIVKRLYRATGQQSGQLSLAARSTPRLRNNWCWGGRHCSAYKKGPMAGPHPALTLVGCD